MLLKNESDATVNFKTHGHPRIVVEPGETIEMPDAYCVPRKGESPDTELPSIMAMLAPQLVPVDRDEPKRKLAEQKAAVKAAMAGEVPDFQELVKAGMPRAKARAKVERAMAAKQVREDELEEDMTDADASDGTA